MFQSFVDPGHRLWFAGQVEQQAFKHLIVSLPDEALGERQGDAGITLRDVAVVQNNDGGSFVDGCDGACLKKVYSFVLYRKFYIELLLMLRAGFRGEKRSDFPGRSYQFFCLFLRQQGRGAGLFVVTDLVGEMIIVGGGIRLVLDNLIAGACSADDDGFVQDTLRVGGEQNAGEIRFKHLLYDDVHRESSWIKLMYFAVGENFGALRVGENIPDAHTDFLPRHLQEGFKLSRERTAIGILQGGAGADGKGCGIGEVRR